MKQPRTHAELSSLAADINRLTDDDFIALLGMIRPVTVKECAAALGVATSTIYRLVNKGAIPYLQSNSRYFRLSAVFEHMRRRGDDPL